MKNSQQQWLRMAEILAQKAESITDIVKKAEVEKQARNARRLAALARPDQTRRAS
jgi:hypothetical protein